MLQTLQEIKEILAENGFSEAIPYRSEHAGENRVLPVKEGQKKRQLMLWFDGGHSND